MSVAQGPLRVAVVSKCAMSKLGVEVLLAGGRFQCQQVPILTQTSEMKKYLLADIPDIIIITIQIYYSDINGVADFIRLIKKSFPAVKVAIMLDVYIKCVVNYFFTLGVQGVTSLNKTTDELGDFFSKIVRGYVCHYNYTEYPVDLLMVKCGVPLSLSDNESQVLNYLLAGYSIATSAILLSRTKKTIAGQKASAMKKLGLKSYSQLVAVKNILTV